MLKNLWFWWFVFFVSFVLYGTYQFYQGGNEEGYGRSLCGAPMGTVVQLNAQNPTFRSYAKKYNVSELYIRTCNFTFSGDLYTGANIVIPDGKSLYVWIVWFLIIFTPFFGFIFKNRRR